METSVMKELTSQNIFACLFSVHNTISLSRHEQVCLLRLRFERYFFCHHRATKMIMSRMFKRKYADLDGNNKTYGKEQLAQYD